jgi:hypothetical protein
LSRLKALKWLILTFPLSLGYVRKFVPPLKVILAVRDLLANIIIPKYAPTIEIAKFNTWHTTQLQYSYEAEALWREVNGGIRNTK